jgi:hypothetical protein
VIGLMPNGEPQFLDLARVPPGDVLNEILNVVRDALGAVLRNHIDSVGREGIACASHSADQVGTKEDDVRVELLESKVRVVSRYSE